MNAFSLRLTAVCFISLASLANAQSKPGYIGSSLSLVSPTVAGTPLYSISLTVYYPVGLTPPSYISATQLTRDFQGAVAAYAAQQDPLEAILSTALAAVLQKYPQISGGSITAFTLGQSIGTIALPGNAISVVIGGPTTVSSAGSQAIPLQNAMPSVPFPSLLRAPGPSQER